MNGKGTRQTLVWLTLLASCAASVASFLFLFRLRDDPLPSLAERFQFAAYLQPIPYATAIAFALCLRRRLKILKFLFAAVIGCGAFGGWWLGGLAELRRTENEPVRRRALGNILPDIGGQVASVEALLWPFVAIGIIGAATLIGWAQSRNARVVRDGAF